MQTTRHQPRQRGAEPEGAHDQHAGGGPRAYWDYVYSIQAVDVARQSLALASKLLSDNKIRVEVGTMAPMDVVQAEAEEATRQQALTTATATMRTAELSLKRLIVSGTNDPLWAQHIEPVDRPDFQTGVDRRRRRRALGAPAAHRSADRAQRLRVEQRAAEVAARSGAARRRRARHLRRVRPRRHAVESRRASGLDRSANGHPGRRRLQQRAEHAVQSRLPELAVRAERQLSHRRKRGAGAGRAHAAAHSAEPGADSRERAARSRPK